MGEVKEGGLREVLLSNEAFLRLARGFEMYQKVFTEMINDQDKAVVKDRMGKLYEQKSALPDEPEPRQRAQRFLDAKDEMLRLCETGQFTVEKFADVLISTGFAEQFLKSVSHKAGDVEEGTGHVMVNSIVGYELGKENEMSLHIKPTQIKDFREIMKIVSVGFTEIADAMADGRFEGVEELCMESWLLGSDFTEKIKQFFGDDVVTTGPSSLSAEEEVQTMALHYNSRSLETFLKTGQKPEVRKLVMSRAEFIEKFATK